MTEVSEAAKAKAVELANAADCDCKWTYTDLTSSPALSALARLLQEVSDAAKESTVRAESCAVRLELLAPFILPEPVDPVVLEARKLACECLHNWSHAEIMAGCKDETPALNDLRRAIRRGMEMVK